MSSNTYHMRISLNVLQHLGIGLYSSIPAVLSEIFDFFFIFMNRQF